MAEESNDIILEGAFLVERACAAGLRMLDLACVPARQSWGEGVLAGGRHRASISAAAQGAVPPAQSIVRVMREADIAKEVGYPFHRGVIGRAQRPRERRLAELLALVEGARTTAAGAEGGATHLGEGAASAGSPRATTILMVLPEVSDPENMGACFRNAAALGCAGIILGPRGPDPLSRRVLRVSMGASLCLPWARVCDSLAMIKEAGFHCAACVLDKKALPISRYAAPKKLALVLGNEASGLSSLWLGQCDTALTLPMHAGLDSLNLATAAALFAYIFSV